ncbi:MAG: MutS-related protein [Spirosomataceae bacterium]
MDLINFYQNRIEQYTQQFENLKIRLNQLSISRILSFLFIVSLLFCFFFFDDFGTWFLLGALAAAVVFLRMVRQYDQTKDEMEFVDKLREINQNELNLLQNKPSFLDNGNDYKSDDGFLNDLDIFGQGSIFHRINRTATKIGLEKLVSAFQNPLLEKTRIIHNQQIINELSTKAQFKQDLLANNLLIDRKDDTIKDLLNTIEAYQYQFEQPFWNLLRWFWSALAVAVIYLAISIAEIQLVFFFLIIGLAIIGTIQKKTQKIHQLVSGQRRVLERYSNALQIIDNEPFTNETLSQIKQKNKAGLIALKELNSIGRLFDQRLNAMVSTLSNGLFLYDIHLVLAIEKWMKKYQFGVREWFEGLAEIETYNSLATFKFNHPDYVFPEPQNQELKFEAEDLGHPLLTDNQRVRNNISLGTPQRMFLVTGSNMSGKSTFLRTLGVNLLLAQMGSVVCAKRMEFLPMRLLTSLHQSDSLQENTSYFFAELKKLKSITKQIENGTVALVLLDEILRGTNSEDKRYGTQKVIEKLMNFGCLTLIATHDLELGRLQESHVEIIENLCFESQIIENDLLFDYKLRKGVAKNKNATFLLKKMEIIS